MDEIKGVNGQVQFDGQYVTITRRGFMARSTIGKGEKRLHISQISAVQWKPAGAVMNGFMQFTIPGGIERRSKAGSQSSQAAKDENSVMFNRKQQPAFEQLRSALDAAIARHHAPQAAASSTSVADELAKLANLRQQGILSDHEFQQAKARLIGG